MDGIAGRGGQDNRMKWEKVGWEAVAEGHPVNPVTPVRGEEEDRMSG